jgi:hypothetical protein
MSEGRGFYKCPECGDVQVDRRLQCSCGYRVAPEPLRPHQRDLSKEPFPYQAAYYSAILPLGALCAMLVGSCFLRESGVAAGIMGLMAVLLLGSMVSGVVALCGLPKYGPSRILLRALFGIGLSSGIIAWWVWGLLLHLRGE